MNPDNPETELSNSYQCGEVLFDREGCFSAGKPSCYQLLSHDHGEWNCVCYHHVQDGKVHGGSHVEVVFNCDLAKAERIGSVTLPIPPFP